MAKFTIYDWSGNIQFDGAEFESAKDAWVFIMTNSTEDVDIRMAKYAVVPNSY